MLLDNVHISLGIRNLQALARGRIARGWQTIGPDHVHQADAVELGDLRKRLPLLDHVDLHVGSTVHDVEIDRGGEEHGAVIEDSRAIEDRGVAA